MIAEASQPLAGIQPSNGAGAPIDEARRTVLVGFAEASAAPEVVWSLADAGFTVVAFARRGRPSAVRHSRHVMCHEITAPEASVERALNDLQSLMGALVPAGAGAPNVLLPLDDTAVWLCSRAALPEGWISAGPAGPQADLALNKFLQVEAARAAGFNVPQTALVRTVQDATAFADTASFPIILKAADCVSVVDGRRYTCRKWICADRGELNRALADWAERVPLLAQSFVAGVGEGVFGLATHAGIAAWSAHRRLRMMNPQGSGSSACISQAVTADVQAHVEAMVGGTGWQGLFMIELLRNKAGRVYFVELNGRPWGSMALSRRQGLEYPAWHVQLALGGPAPSEVSVEPGLVCRHVGRELMHLLFVMRGPRSAALNGWPGFWSTLGRVARVRRSDTFYNWRRADSRVFLADAFYTVREQLFKPRAEG